MNRKDIYAALAVAGILTLTALTAHLTRFDQNPTKLTFTQKEAEVASEKTIALKALFESDAFKNGSSYDQRRLIEAVEKVYL